MNKENFDPKILELCARVTRKRARTVIDHLLQYGFITTEELQERYGYDHPPRAIRDVREEGIPLVTYKITSNRTGRQIGAYKFDSPDNIKQGRIGGRKAFSKAFKTALINKYGQIEAFTLDKMDSRYLQIDHRIPYEVAGDVEYDETNLDAYMLLDGASQRAKSFSCENCLNLNEIQDIENCNTCYWAFPENYKHEAMRPIRRIDLKWVDNDVAVYENLRAKAEAVGEPLSEYIKNKLSKL